MHFGLFVMPEPFPWSNWTLSYDLKLEEIVKAEQLTYDEVWVEEHHTGADESISGARYLSRRGVRPDPSHRLGDRDGQPALP